MFILGQKIKSFRTLRSQYDAGYIIEAISDDNNVYRMNINEFLKIINNVEFEVTFKKHYYHLTILEDKK
jgi:hypothetical protein